MLNSLKAETKGAIKTKTKELKYPDLTEPDRFRKSNALEIDITEFEYDPETSIFRFAEGGAVPMEEQMKLFEEGGLRDEGGMVDEESGNDVPIGSTRKEVRDDIPAMLSEGEFVFPADVVRFLGLERLMNLRQEAKMGLKQMEAMGQMGNSDEATMPDDLPFGMADLVIVEGEMEPQEKAHGGVIHANQGTFVTPIYDPQNQDVRPYTNDGGQTVRYIPFLGGNPVYPIPEGYVPLDQATAPEAEETPEAIPTGGDDDGSTPPPQSEFQKAGGWDMDFGNPPDANKVELWIKEAEKASTFGKLTTGIAAAINPLMGAVAYAGGKTNEKGIKDNLQRALDAASKTPVKGQMKRINNVDERLTTKTGQGILGKALTEIFGTLAPNLNLTKEEEQKVKTNIGTGDPQPEPPKDEQPPTETPPEVETPTVSPVQDVAPPEVGYTPINDARDMLDEIPTPFVDESAMNMLDEIIESAKAPTAVDQTDEMLSASGAATADYSAPLVTVKDEVSKNIENVRVGRGENDPSGTAGLENLSNLLLESYATESRTGGEPTKGPSGQPTTYVAGQQRRGSTSSKVSTGGGDDDGPSFADEMRQQQQAERESAQEEAKASVEDVKSLAEQIEKVGAVPKGQTAIQAAGKAMDTVKEKEEDPDKYDPRNMKSGGLASRKKKKK